MSEVSTKDEMPVEEWLQIRKGEAQRIDPRTAEVDWWYAQMLDPYGIGLDIPEEADQVGRAYFARSPGSDIWVWFGDLPQDVERRLWEMHKSKLSFPAGLPSAAFTRDLFKLLREEASLMWQRS